MALPSKEYWEMRSRQNILTSEDNGLEIAKKVEKVYQLVMQDIENEINRFYARYAIQGKISLEEAKKRLNPKELRRFHSQAKEYYEYAKRNHWRSMYTSEALLLSGKAYMSRLEELKASIDFMTQGLYEEEIKLLQGGLHSQYEESFLHTMYDYQTGLEVGVSFTQPNKEAIDSAIRQKWRGSNYSERIWSNRDKLSEILQIEMPRMFVLGDNPLQAAKRMRDLYEPKFAERNYKDKNGQKKRLTSYFERVARTEFIHVANESSLDAVEEMNRELGGDLFTEYEFVATLDGKTSEICGEMDGKRFFIKDKQAGTNFPPLHPNCRSAYMTVIDGQVFEQRTARDPNGKSYYVRGDMTYKEWWDSLTDDSKLQYKIAKNAKADAVQLADYQKRLGRKGATKSIAEFQKIKYYEPEKWKELQGEYRRGKPPVDSSDKKTSANFTDTEKQPPKQLKLADDSGTIKLNDNEQSAINTYISSGSYPINYAFRNQELLTPEQTEMVKNLDSALDKLPKYEGTVYRSISSDYLDDKEKFFKTHQEGFPVKYDAYTSTAQYVYDPSMDIQMIIQSKTAVDLRGVNESEQELLFRRNSLFLIKKIDGKTIYMEEIQNE